MRAHQRLLLDLKEVQTTPAADLDGISASPLENNIFEWHVNLFVDDHPLHLIMNFDEEYPKTPPKIACSTPFPHANIERTAVGLTICMDMLEPPTSEGSAYAGWSSAMSVLSVLIQLHAFLADHRMHYMDGMGSMNVARSSMLAFHCTACSHRGSEPWPPTEHHASHTKPAKRIVCRPSGTFALACDADVTSTDDALTRRFPYEAKIKPEGQWKARPSLAGQSQIAIFNPFDALPTLVDSTEDSAVSLSPPPTLSAPVAPAALQAVKVPVVPILLSAPMTKAVAKATPTPKAAAAVKTPNAVKAAAQAGRTKAQKKNLTRCLRRQAVANKNTAETTAVGDAVTTLVELDDGDTIRSEAPTVQDLDERSSASESGTDADTATDAIGSFVLLGYDALIILIEHLELTSAQALACTCKQLAAVGEDGMLWRALFVKHYPASALSASSMSEWKHCFMLELSATQASSK